MAVDGRECLTDEARSVADSPTDYLRAFYEALNRLPLPESIRARISGLVEGAMAAGESAAG